MTEDDARQARLDKLITEMESTIGDAREASARMAELFRAVGLEDGELRDAVRSDRCSPALRAMVEEDLARLDREMKDAEAALLAQTGSAGHVRPRRVARHMTRI